MDFLKRVVKVEKSTPDSLNLRRIFGSCGEIRALHASGFIEFAEAASSERAVSLKLDIDGVRVLRVDSAPHLVQQYRVINPSAFGEGDVLQSNSSAGRVGANRTERPSSSVPPSGLLQSLKSTNTPISHASADIVESRPPFSNAALLPATPSPHSPFMAPLPPLATSSSPPANPFPCIENHILMRLCGENITLDLRSLAGDPATVIELLKLTASERGNWLIVGAYFRRTGNPAGAVAVTTAMLEALKQFNISENELKPAFLLLSGCYTDLARRDSDPDKVSHYNNQAQQWLQKVYGPSTPPLAPPNVDDPKRPKATTPPRAPASLRSRIDTTSAPSAPRLHPTSPNHRMMEREIQSLRDRHANMKRKLEETVEIERVSRRRLQRELDDVSKQRDEARRMESLALAQMRKEVDSRRRAEV